MELVYTLKGLDCPNCSAKIEHDVAALDMVSAAEVNLMQQTLTVQTEHTEHEALHSAVEEIVHRHEPDVAVLHGKHGTHSHVHTHAHEHGECCEHDHEHAHAHGHDHAHEHEHSDHMPLRIAVGAVTAAAGLILEYLTAYKTAAAVLLLISFAVMGYDVIWNALRNIVRGRVFDEHFLMSAATGGALALGEFPEAAAVMLLYQIGEYLQSLAVQHSRRSISSLLDIRPDTANVLRSGEPETVHCEDVTVGEQILVKPGERIPLDGVILRGESSVDTSALTGESVPRSVKPGDAALSGCINGSGLLTVEVTKPFGESTASKIIEAVEHASAKKASAEQFITKFARYYTPAVVISALLLAVLPPLLLHGAWAEWIHRALVFLIISCPCALVISVPLTFFGGIGAASKAGVLIKGANYLDMLSQVTEIVFDKTGTLTEGTFAVTEVLPAAGFDRDAVLEAAAYCEQLSDHPIARSVQTAFGRPVDTKDAVQTEIPGCGVKTVIGSDTLLAGNSRLMEQNGIAFTPCAESGTKVYIAKNGRFAGCIRISDQLKQDSAAAIVRLRKMGMDRMLMLTGDEKQIAQETADALKLDGCKAELLPEQKLSALEEELQTQSDRIAFVGDGINDAPVLARADIGIAMGAFGSDAAIEAADVVLMTDSPMTLADGIAAARKTKRIVTENIVFALGVKILLLVLGALGIANMWAAVFGDVGVTLLAVLNSLRAGQPVAAADSLRSHHTSLSQQ